MLRDLERLGWPAFCRLLLLLCLALAASPARAGEPLKGVALVIGQSAYQTLPALPNPEHDARAIEALLAKLGFTTNLLADAPLRKLRRAVDGFIEDAEGADVALVYYSGHGIEAGGVNYLIPTDAGPASLDEADRKLVSLQDVLERLRGKARITILLLDACRSDPFPKDAVLKRTVETTGVPIQASGLGATKGVTVVENPDNTASENVGEVIGFAAEPGHAALDGEAGGDSPYAAALLKHLTANQGYDFGQVMTMVTEEVYLATKTRQRPWTNASLRRFLSFGGKAEEASPDDAALTGARRSLLLSIAATPQELRQAVETLARDQALPLDPLYGMLKELQVDTAAGPEEIDRQLRAGAENLKKLIADKVAPLRKDPELTRLAALADRAQAQGAIALAKDYRAKASARADELDKVLDQREAEVTADRIELASTYAEEAGTALLAFDYGAAAVQYRKAYEQVKGRDAHLAFQYSLGEADALSGQGYYKGDNEALQQAIGLYETVLGATARDKSPDDWATTEHNLGNAFERWGELGPDTENLTKAVAAYGAALTVRTPEHMPLEWAATQNGLGLALTMLGERGMAESLPKAVAAYEAALTVRTREHMPLEWAAIQSNLCTARKIMGDIDKAIAACEAALTELTRERLPNQWAKTQSNLGNALLDLAERKQDDIGSLTKAAAAYEAALSEQDRQRMPLDWALTQHDLAYARFLLGQRESGTENLVKAVAAYEAALTVTTVERWPSQWAMNQFFLGNTLATLGERETGAVSLTKAVAAYEAALSVVFSRPEFPDSARSGFYWNLGPNLDRARESLRRRYCLIHATSSPSGSCASRTHNAP